MSFIGDRPAGVLDIGHPDHWCIPLRPSARFSARPPCDIVGSPDRTVLTVAVWRGCTLTLKAQHPAPTPIRRRSGSVESDNAHLESRPAPSPEAGRSYGEASGGPDAVCLIQAIGAGCTSPVEAGVPRGSRGTGQVPTGTQVMREASPIGAGRGPTTRTPQLRALG